MTFGPYLVLYYSDQKEKNISNNSNSNSNSNNNYHSKGEANDNIGRLNPSLVIKNNNKTEKYRNTVKEEFTGSQIMPNSFKNNISQIQRMHTLNTAFSNISEIPFIEEKTKEAGKEKAKAFYHGGVNVKNQRHGFGVFLTEEGKYYEGKWNKNKFEGFGRMIDSKGVITEGFFISSGLVGKGERYKSNLKYSYKGEFNNSKKEGLGVEETEDYLYKGDFQADCMHGKGKMTYKKFNDSYEGSFCRGLIEGEGLYTWKNKESYFGQFVKGMMHGFGTYKWPSGREFYGNYVENLKEGPGEFKWKKGKSLKCNYLKGKPVGMGFLKSSPDKSEKVISLEEIKEVLKTETKLSKEHSYLEYVESDEESRMHFDFCSIRSDKA
eukprot:CAMPEP_0170538066 /NCGR_PEP_ID=MMETSP0209-20121228/103093_1 /TAXON_ID=665100 ORGANISM="Litonotus pictus, Strain P1" /NCGR_SAMPLE_ID=MMETSP0209 /ASSEMBLY_ACC=CAM_ASM_000301 /LENGTH=378 /DNA_ID=CAMNT_0010839689 /DNA_START=352 /DNA_END=1484 /DNA_ORIENTATION=+